uniref:DUF6783 domain-containing protein n=1 Tax=Anaerobutyricum hallii TaxID=39488 RepID=UPI003FEDAD9F
MKAKYTANWGVQIVGMIFQTRSKAAKTNAKFLWSKSHSTKSQNSTNFLGVLFHIFLSNSIEYLYLQRPPISNTTN